MARTAMYYVVPKSFFDEKELYKYQHSASLGANGMAQSMPETDPVYVLKVLEVVTPPHKGVVLHADREA